MKNTERAKKLLLATRCLRSKHLSDTSIILSNTASQAGVTLVELMIVLAIIAVLATLSAPSLQNVRAERILNSQVTNLRTAIQEARTMAVADAKVVSLCANIANATDCNNANNILDNGWMLVDSNGLIRRYQNTSAVQVRLPAGVNKIDFQINGFVSTQRQVTLCHPRINQQTDLNILRSGLDRASALQAVTACP